MKKTILVTLILVLLSFALGFFINQKFFSDNHSAEVKNEKVIDSAKILEQQEMENLRPTYTIRGGLPNYKDKYRYIVDDWYHFSFVVTSGGCTNQKNSDIDVAQNHRTDSILKKRIGKNWYKKFEKSADSLYKIDSTSIVIAENDAEIKRLISQKLNNKSKDAVSYKCYPTTDENLKMVSFEWRGKIYKDSTQVSHIRATVDMKQKKVVQIEKTATEGSPFMFY